MADTAFHHLLDTKTHLARVLATNNEVCGVLAALLGRVVIEAANRGIPITGVRMGTLRATGKGVFTSRISFSHDALWIPAGIGQKGSLEDYLANKGVQLAKVLAMNHSMGVLFEALTEKLVEYAKTNGAPFSDIWVHNEGAFVSKDDELVIKVGFGQKPYKLKEVASDVRSPHDR